MQFEFPYQIVTFLDKVPAQNEPVYYGDRGWYPQMAIKRRFALNGTPEEEFIKELKGFFNSTVTPAVVTGELLKPGHMPVRAIHANNQAELKNLHEKLLDSVGTKMVSKYPDREGKNYYPHITAEYNGAFVIPVDEYTNKSFTMRSIWLLKDINNENSLAYRKIR